eukprot:3422355-Lingulodinium_polyedra.AAC.1
MDRAAATAAGWTALPPSLRAALAELGYSEPSLLREGLEPEGQGARQLLIDCGWSGEDEATRASLAA